LIETTVGHVCVYISIVTPLNKNLFKNGYLIALLIDRCMLTLKTAPVNFMPKYYVYDLSATLLKYLSFTAGCWVVE
jgi:hypothetical protein